jgi:hypothetical protein
MGRFFPILVSFEVAQGVVWPEEWWNTLSLSEFFAFAFHLSNSVRRDISSMLIMKHAKVTKICMCLLADVDQNSCCVTILLIVPSV